MFRNALFIVNRSLNRWVGTKQQAGNPVPDPGSLLWPVVVLGLAWTAAHKWAQLLDWSTVIDARLKNLEAKVTQVNTNVDETNRRLDDLSRRMDRRFDKLERRFNKQDQHLTQHDQQFNEIQLKLDYISKLLMEKRGQKHRLPVIRITNDY